MDSTRERAETVGVQTTVAESYRRSARVIVRIWKTGLDETRAREYDRFAAERSLGMFKAQPGFLGVLFAREAGSRSVITLWQDEASIQALDRAADYLATVEAIERTGFLQPPQSVEILPVERAWTAPDLVTDFSET